MMWLLASGKNRKIYIIVHLIGLYYDISINPTEVTIKNV